MLKSCLYEISKHRSLQIVRIISPYHAQCNLLCKMFNNMSARMENVTKARLEMLRNCSGTVSSCQALEHEVRIFIARRWPLDWHPLGRDSSLESLLDLCVMLRRARCNVIIIASMNNIYDLCPGWDAFIDRVRREINWYIAKTVGFIFLLKPFYLHFSTLVDLSLRNSLSLLTIMSTLFM